MDEANQIPTHELKITDVPGPHASRDQLEAFCQTVDGYRNEQVSADELIDLAERLEAAGWHTATLEELRLAGFIRQRELRWTDGGFDDSDEPLVRRLRIIVDEIRRRLTC